MSGTFHRFQTLPQELQLMVFEQAIFPTQKPRIGLIVGEEFERFHPDPFDPVVGNLVAWKFRLENYEQLLAEKPDEVAWNLLSVSSVSRYVATKFLHRYVEIIPMIEYTYMGVVRTNPYFSRLPRELGLSVKKDVFWIPDSLEKFLKTPSDLGVGHGQTEQDAIQSVMISLSTFEKAFHWKSVQSRENYEEVSETHLGRRSLLRELFWSFPRSRNLIIMVDVPRGHISWDQIQVVGANDPTPYTLSDADAPARCYSALEKYMAVQSDYARIILREFNTHLMKGFRPNNFDTERRWTQPWPELSFAFRKPLLPPASSQP